jgi:putative endonuclease
VSYIIYILRTSSNTFYTGQTNDLDKRLNQHKNKTKKSAKYLRSFRSFELAYTEKVPTLSKALKREIKIKNLSHDQKENLISEADKG